MSFEAGSISGEITLDAKPGLDAFKAVKAESRKMKDSVDQSMSGVRDAMKQSAKASEASPMLPVTTKPFSGTNSRSKRFRMLA